MKRRPWCQNPCNQHYSQLQTFTLLTTLCKNVHKNYMCKIILWRQLGKKLSMTESEQWDYQLSPRVQSREKLSRVCRKMLYLQGINSIFLQHLRDFGHFDYIMRQGNLCYTCYENVFLYHFWHWKRHQKQVDEEITSIWLDEFGKESQKDSKCVGSNPGLPSEGQNITSKLPAASGYPEGTGMKICTASRITICTSKENWYESQKNSEMKNWGKGLKLIAIPVLRLSSLRYFWQNDFGI